MSTAEDLQKLSFISDILRCCGLRLYKAQRFSFGCYSFCRVFPRQQRLSGFDIHRRRLSLFQGKAENGANSRSFAGNSGNCDHRLLEYFAWDLQLIKHIINIIMYVFCFIPGEKSNKNCRHPWFFLKISWHRQKKVYNDSQWSFSPYKGYNRRKVGTVGFSESCR